MLELFSCLVVEFHILFLFFVSTCLDVGFIGSV